MKDYTDIYHNGTGGWFTDENTSLAINLIRNYNEDIISFVGCGGGNPGDLFNHIHFTPILSQYVQSKLHQLPDEYICIQVRNTDIKCDYKPLQEILIASEVKTVYVATDDKKVVKYIEKSCPSKNIICFTSFPENLGPDGDLHRSDLPQLVKLGDAVSDLVIAAKSKELHSKSGGGFIRLCRFLHRNNHIVVSLLRRSGIRDGGRDDIAYKGRRDLSK